jgi:hypothetical protein
VVEAEVEVPSAVLAEVVEVEEVAVVQVALIPKHLPNQKLRLI